MKLIIEKAPTGAAVPTPVPILISSVDTSSWYRTRLPLRQEEFRVGEPAFGVPAQPVRTPGDSAKPLTLTVKPDNIEIFDVPHVRDTRGLALGILDQLISEQGALIKLYDLDAYAGTICDLIFFATKQPAPSMCAENGTPKPDFLSADSIYGIRTRDCREYFSAMTVFGTHVLDNPEFRITPRTRTLLVSVFDRSGDDFDLRPKVAWSVLDAIRLNTTTTNIFDCP